MSVKDELVKIYFEVATDISLEDTAEIVKGHPKEAKMRLAREIVTMYHSKDAAEKAEADWQNTFSEGGAPENVLKIFVSETIKVSDALVQAQVVSSKSELRRLEIQGAVSFVVSGEKISNLDEAAQNKVIRIGKHRFIEIEKK